MEKNKKNTEEPVLMNGNEAAAEGVAVSEPDVVAAYPITPQTDIPEKLSEKCEEGSLDAEFENTDSEHAAMSTAIGANAVGARVYTASSSQGTLHMMEMVFWAANARRGFVMGNVSREVCAPWALGDGYGDSMAARDSGWIQLYCKDAQEIVDTYPMAYRLAETMDIPVMVIHEGFKVSKANEGVFIPKKEDIRKFLPPYDPADRIDFDNPDNKGAPIIGSDPYMEIRERFHLDMLAVPQQAKLIEKEYRKIIGRYCPLVLEQYKTYGAENIIISMGSTCDMVREVIDGHPELKLGLIRLKMFRPFPVNNFRGVLFAGNKVRGIFPKRLIVLERSITPGTGGHITGDVKSALCGLNIYPARIDNYIVGLNGGNISTEMIRGIVLDSASSKSANQDVFWYSGGRR